MCSAQEKGSREFCVKPISVMFTVVGRAGDGVVVVGCWGGYTCQIECTVFACCGRVYKYASNTTECDVQCCWLGRVFT
jgi:hypothetical protein